MILVSMDPNNLTGSDMTAEDECGRADSRAPVDSLEN
jgi:hypothetical protein